MSESIKLNRIAVDRRAYDYATVHHLLDEAGQFDKSRVRRALETSPFYRRVPQYLRKACSCDGLQFSSLSEFPVGPVFRVCRDSDDGTFLVGAKVYRMPVKPGFTLLDGICFVQEAAQLDAEFCDSALRGACFERVE